MLMLTGEAHADLRKHASGQLHKDSTGLRDLGGSSKEAASSFDALATPKQKPPAGVQDGKTFVSQALGLAICICPKCGSTALYNFIYEMLFKRRWPYSQRPWVHNLLHPTWKGLWRPLKGFHNDSALRYRIMFTRDPRRRLISAFDDKYACNSSFETSSAARLQRRAAFVNELLALEKRAGGAEQNDAGAASPKCTTLDRFKKALSHIQRGGYANKVEQHIRSQSQLCLNDRPLSWWDMISNLANSTAAAYLANALGNVSDANKLVPMHCASIRRAPNGPDTASWKRPCVLETANSSAAHIPPDWSPELEQWVSSDLEVLQPMVANPTAIIRQSQRASIWIEAFLNEMNSSRVDR